MLSEQQRAEFTKRGVIWLRGAFSSEDAARMRRRVWARLARTGGVAEDDPATWAAAQVTGISKPSKRDAVFTAVGSAVVRGAVDDLLGRDQWDPPREWGTIMVTFPDRSRPWALSAGGMHTDYGIRHGPEPLFGVKVFAFLSDVRPRGGGTVVITGSHRLMARYAASVPPQARCGLPGDVLHRHAPNTGSYPRMMMTKNPYRRGNWPVYR